MNTTEMQARAEQARELAGKATEGPWYAVKWQSLRAIAAWAFGVENKYDAIFYPDGLCVEDDVNFIAASRTLVPQLAEDVLALIAELAALRDETKRSQRRVEQLRSAIDDICQATTHEGACAIAFAATLADEEMGK